MRHLEGFVVPGLVDVHSHLGLGPQGTLSLDAAAGHALADRDAGVLLVRDAGSPLDVSPLQDRPELPRMLRSGRHIARPKRYHRGAAWELGDVAELPEAVYREARSGDGWVKVVGDWIDRAVGD